MTSMWKKFFGYPEVEDKAHADAASENEFKIRFGTALKSAMNRAADLYESFKKDKDNPEAKRQALAAFQKARAIQLKAIDFLKSKIMKGNHGEKIKKHLEQGERLLDQVEGIIESILPSRTSFPAPISNPTTPRRTLGGAKTISSTPTPFPKQQSSERTVKDMLKGVDKKLADMILNNVYKDSKGLTFRDVVGHARAIQIIREAVIMPRQRPDFFVGLRKPSKAMLLFGPPGTGKTHLAKCTAAEANSRFFSLSASALTSKWVGEGEKLVKTLFQVARAVAPTIIFIDEIDSLLTARRENEQESSRRIKTEFFTQLDGCGNDNDAGLVFVLAATNLPWELDTAALRRFESRVYLGMGDAKSREAFIQHSLSKNQHSLGNSGVRKLAMKTELYSNSDLQHLCEQAAKQAMRELTPEQFLTMDASRLRPISYADFEVALSEIRPSVTLDDARAHISWAKDHGAAAS